MTISTESSTFEFTREWLLSSECFVRDAMLAQDPGLDAARDEIRSRIHEEEVDDSPNEDEQQEGSPDLPPPVSARPRAIVQTITDERRMVGTGSFAGRGSLDISIEVLIPDDYKINQADDSAETRASKRASAIQWAKRLSKTIRCELLSTTGHGSPDGQPYLNARDVNFKTPPSFPEDGETEDYMGWVYEVPWGG